MTLSPAERLGVASHRAGFVPGPHRESPTRTGLVSVSTKFEWANPDTNCTLSTCGGSAFLPTHLFSIS